MVAQATAEVLNGEVLVDRASKPNGAEVHEETNLTPNNVPKTTIECDVLVIGGE